jgi:4-carboxymuconolactone decarboxylase
MKTPPVSSFEPRLAELRRQLQQPGLAALEEKTLHLVVSALDLAGRGNDAALHGLAARRAGASWAEIEALGALIECHGGLPACGSGTPFVQAVRSLEQQAQVEGAVVAYG